ncbi:MAG TPA: hypothetical protein PLL32_07620 [Anaeromyxobacteraceae bacterium]|nr:hypothetical protein [Anaeromyxobacteraceae bacterium]
MSGGLLFVSQSLLDAWADQGRIDVDGQSIALASGEGRGRRYALEPAVRFLRVAGGGEDVERLVARVKTLAQIRERGGDAVARSVVLGEVAYEVEPGYLAEASAVEAASRMAPPARGQGRDAARGDDRTLPGDLEDRRQEAEALARFLLDNLS